MLKYLTKEWHDEYRRLFNETQPERPGMTARMQYVITGTPEGDVAYYWLVDEGRLKEAQLGQLDDAEFTITMAYEDNLKLQKGEIEANAAFMQGKMKVTGNMGKLLQMMPLTNSPEYKQLEQDVRAVTEF